MLGSSTNCTEELPSVIQNLTGSGLIFLVLAGVSSWLVLCCTSVFVDELLYVRKFVHPPRRSLLTWLLGIYPIFSWTALVGIFVPRSWVMVDSFASIYLAICIYKFFQLMLDYMGGEEKFLQVMEGMPIPLRGPPFTCCLPKYCFPELLLSRRSFGYLKGSIVQLPLLRPFFYFVIAVVWTEEDYFYLPGKISTHNMYLYIIVFITASVLVALFSLILVFRMTQDTLCRYNIRAKFFCLQLVLVLYSVQGALFGILSNNGALPCDFPLTSIVLGRLLNNILLIGEMFILGVIARCYYKLDFTELGSEPDSITTVV